MTSWRRSASIPHEADVHPDVETETLVEKAAHPKVIGIGESGLDYYYDHRDRARQRRASAPISPPRARPSCR